MKKQQKILKNKIRRARRVRMHVGKGSAAKPRLSIFRSNVHIYAQVIDDLNGKTLAAATSLEVKPQKGTKKTDVARAVGKLVAERAKKAGVEKVVFDRGSYKYHGRVKALADGAREGGLKV